MNQPVIELTSTKEHDIVAVLKNPTAHEINFFHDSMLNPTRLVFRAAKDEKAEFNEGFDERRRMKFDRTIRKAMYKKVPAGGELVLAEAFFKPETDGTFSLRWGPYSYGGLKPGWYTVQLTYDHSENGLVPDAWKGQFRAGGYVQPELGVRSPSDMSLAELVTNSDVIAVAAYRSNGRSANPPSDPFDMTSFSYSDILKGHLPPKFRGEIQLIGLDSEGPSTPRYRSSLSAGDFAKLALDHDGHRPFVLFLKEHDSRSAWDPSSSSFALAAKGGWESIDQKVAIQELLKKK